MSRIDNLSPEMLTIFRRLAERWEAILDATRQRLGALAIEHRGGAAFPR